MLTGAAVGDGIVAREHVLGRIFHVKAAVVIKIASVSSLVQRQGTRNNNRALLIDNCLLSFAPLSLRRISDGAPVQYVFHVDSDQNILTILSGFKAVVCI